MKRTTPLKRTAFKRKPRPAPTKTERVPRDLTLLGPTLLAARTGRMARDLGAEKPAPAPKPEPFRAEAWLRAVRSIPCVFCGAPVQAAHRNEGKGMGTKVDDSLAAALCPPEHAEIDQGKSMTRDERRARMDRAIVLTLRELVRRGLVGVVA
jgi:hypothetical protein